jgi:hypothetical protein
MKVFGLILVCLCLLISGIKVKIRNFNSTIFEVDNIVLNDPTPAPVDNIPLPPSNQNTSNSNNECGEGFIFDKLSGKCIKKGDSKIPTETKIGYQNLMSPLIVPNLCSSKKDGYIKY